MNEGVRNEMSLTRMDALSVEDVRAVNFGREKIYAFLSRIFAKEVDGETLNTIIAVQPTIGLLASSHETEELNEGSRLLQDFISQVKALKGKEKEDLIRDLRTEYATLFLAVGVMWSPRRMKKKHLLVCESAYPAQVSDMLEHKHEIYYGRPFRLVKDAYSRSGFEKRKDFLEPEDHVAVELDFMANLCRQTHLSLDEKNLERASRYLKLQKEFLRDHLLRWVPTLCEDMKDAGESKLYQALAYLTKGFISMEEQLVEELVKILEPLPATTVKPQEADRQPLGGGLDS